MSIPKVNEIKVALLRALGDGQSRLLRDLVPVLAQEFALSPEDLAVRYASGDLKFENLVWWARQHLKDENLITSPGRGVVQITPQGQARLGAESRLTVASAAPETEPVALSVSPEEALDTAMEQLAGRLRDEVLARVKQMPPQHFERLVVDLLLAMGYGFDESSGHVTRYSGDGGIDGLVHEDKLGLSSIYIQAKRYTDTSVGRPEVQQFLGALTGAGAGKGVFITSASFTREARDFAARLQNQKVVLIDGQHLARLMIEHGVGVATGKTLRIQHVDSDYFDEGWDDV
ncbi:restriction endonuclease [Vandammella animalimorsus]|uniref:restriction endonuclease n=1 Tax=Vandammella animalimorsus TaxID=2029117 RepID=UPI00325B1057